MDSFEVKEEYELEDLLKFYNVSQVGGSETSNRCVCSPSNRFRQVSVLCVTADRLKGDPKFKSLVIVISPLISLMKDQVLRSGGRAWRCWQYGVGLIGLYNRID